MDTKTFKQLASEAESLVMRLGKITDTLTAGGIKAACIVAFVGPNLEGDDPNDRMVTARLSGQVSDVRGIARNIAEHNPKAGELMAVGALEGFKNADVAVVKVDVPKGEKS